VKVEQNAVKTNEEPFKNVDKDAAWLSRLPVAAAVITACLVFAYVFIFHKLPLDENPSAWGTFGDYMGGLLNPLISLFTLIVAVQVWLLQKTELRETKGALEKSVEIAALQYQSSERARYEATYVSCRDDITRAVATVADSASAQLTTVTTLSRELETKPPLIAINSHAVSFTLQAPGYEAPLPIEPWDWSVSHGNDARETLRLMLPLCRSIGDALIAVGSMPIEEKSEKFRRLRNSLDELTLSTFTYFLVLHPDGAQYQAAAEAAHVLANLRIQRALGFAKAYLPVSTYSILEQE
jgi:hypothetical protein